MKGSLVGSRLLGSRLVGSVLVGRRPMGKRLVAMAVTFTTGIEMAAVPFENVVVGVEAFAALPAGVPKVAFGAGAPKVRPWLLLVEVGGVTVGRALVGGILVEMSVLAATGMTLMVLSEVVVAGVAKVVSAAGAPLTLAVLTVLEATVFQVMPDQSAIVAQVTFGFG